MNDVLVSQVLIFFYSCLLGMGLGVLYDLFRIFRMMINPHYIGIFIQDVVYFIISGIITFLFVLGLNRGEARFYILAGEGLGWIGYHLTIGEIIYRSSEKIVLYFNKIISNFVDKIKIKIKSKDNN